LAPPLCGVEVSLR